LAADVETFVNISTDKAANPTSTLGRSKRVGERLVAATALAAQRNYLSVRFGNVLGSRGSVVTTFSEQLAAGRPITVTHPDVTRFLMSVPEAVQLVLQAAVIGAPGEVLVLDMGEPVRIVDLARQLMEIANRSVHIVYTGLREGEKLHEELFGAGEEPDFRPVHPAISHVMAPPLEAMRIHEAELACGPSAAMLRLTAPATSLQHAAPSDGALDAHLHGSAA
jgi:FlaA1/EpsC-like NDP-sugar epimerase